LPDDAPTFTTHRRPPVQSNHISPDMRSHFAFFATPSTGSAYYRFEVPGGEFVMRGDRNWQLAFNGVQIGGLHRAPQEALGALARLRSGRDVGPSLSGIVDPPHELERWVRQNSTAGAGPSPRKPRLPPFCSCGFAFRPGAGLRTKQRAGTAAPRWSWHPRSA
jgi:hypothetical protein